MDWFKHMTGSHDDPDFSDAWDEFGDAGPVVFWTTLEVYGREFSSLNDGWLTLSVPYFERKLRRKWKKIEKILTFFQNRSRIYFKKTDSTVSIHIPKFIEIASNWTKRPKRTPTEEPTEAPTEAPTAIEVEEEVEEEKRVSNDTLPSSPSKSNGIPSQEIITLYHEILPGLPRVKVWNESRKRKLKARWTEDKARQNLEWWREYFETVRGSPFLMGDRKEFKADFEWLIEAGNLPKVAEGRYKNGSQQGAFRI